MKPKSLNAGNILFEVEKKGNSYTGHPSRGELIEFITGPILVEAFQAMQRTGCRDALNEKK